MNWVDAGAALFLAFSAWNGFRRGLIQELSGFLAFVAAVAAAFAYGGQLDGFAAGTMHLGPGSAHAAGLCAFAAVAYLVVWSVGFALDRVAKLPLLNVANGALGAALAIGKTLLVLLALDYVATLFPLSDDFRTDLHRSTIARTLGDADAAIDGDLGSHLPGYLQPLWGAAMHHRDDDASPSAAPAP